MNQILTTFLTGLTILSPVVSLGLVPSSYQGMTRRPWETVPYALSGSFIMLFLSVAGWAANRFILPKFGLTALALPVIILIYWGLQKAAGLAFRNHIGFKAGLSLNLNGCLAVGCCLFLVEHIPEDIGLVAATAAGMSAGHLVLSLTLAYIRENIEKNNKGNLFEGWPSLLLLCSLMWLAVNGLGSLIP